MAIVVKHNAALELNVVEYRGAVSQAELWGLADMLAGRAELLRYDTLNIVGPNVRFEVTTAQLDDLFEYYRTLFAPIKFQIFRRAAWVVLSPAAALHIDYWIGGRDMRTDFSSTVRQFGDFAEAGEWLMLNEAELNQALGDDGFTEILRLDLASQVIPAAPQARSGT